MTLDDVVADLYGLLPGDFIAARNGLSKTAKASGDTELAKAIAVLRKPTVGAWLVNSLVREYADEMEEVLALGEQLRAAQEGLAGDELRAVDKRRRQLVATLGSHGRTLAHDRGQKVSEQAAREVEDTLRAAVVDETAAAAVRTGALIDTFTATGLEPVDLDAVTAIPGLVVPPRSTKPTTKGVPKALPSSNEVKAARAALDRAHEDVASAQTQRDETAVYAARAETEHAEAQARLENLRTELRDAERDEADTASELKVAAKSATRAERDYDVAARALERAKARVDHLS